MKDKIQVALLLIGIALFWIGFLWLCYYTFYVIPLEIMHM